MWTALFPGQGSQSVGMGRFLYDHFPQAKQAFEEASDALGQNFKKLCFDGPEADLQLTENAQPALLLVSTATFRVIQHELGLQIGAGAGHSVGEYSAVVAGGALSFPDALQAVRARGRAMQKAVPVGEGGMAAVMGLTDTQVTRLCQWAEAKSGAVPLEPANFNAPGQVVVSGSARAIEWLRTNAKPDLLVDVFPEGVPRMKLIPLAVSAPFHCSLMKPAADEMKHVLHEITFNDSHFPIVQNVTARDTREGRILRDSLVTQVCGAVRWTDSMIRLREIGLTNAVEFGSGKVLSGLSKKIDSTAPVPFNINGLEDIKALESALKKPAAAQIGSEF